MSKGKELVMKLLNKPKLTMKVGGKTFKTKYAITLEKEAWYDKQHPSNKEQILGSALGVGVEPRRLVNNTIICVARWLPMHRLPPLIRSAVLRSIRRRGPHSKNYFWS